MLQMIKRTLLWATAAVAIIALVLVALITWPNPLFAFSLGAGKLTVVSDHPIPPAGGQRFLRDCERLLERSPLKAMRREYRLYVTNEDWRQRLFFIPHREARGFAWYYDFGGHAFLSGADFDAQRDPLHALQLLERLVAPLVKHRENDKHPAVESDGERRR